MVSLLLHLRFECVREAAGIPTKTTAVPSTPVTSSDDTLLWGLVWCELRDGSSSVNNKKENLRRKSCTLSHLHTSAA